MHELTTLNYEYDALEPFIDRETMMIHHSRHHKTYVDNLNKALEGHVELQSMSVEKLLSDLNKVPENIRTLVKNHGGGHANHKLFWSILKKDVEMPSELKVLLERDFGSTDVFKESFKDSALKQFGSGWAWLVFSHGKLKVLNTSNQDTPLSASMIPLLTIDVWEHAYYLKYQNKRVEYINNFFSVIDWEQVHKNYLDAVKK